MDCLALASFAHTSHTMNAPVRLQGPCEKVPHYGSRRVSPSLGRVPLDAGRTVPPFVDGARRARGTGCRWLAKVRPGAPARRLYSLQGGSRMLKVAGAVLGRNPLGPRCPRS